MNVEIVMNAMRKFMYPKKAHEGVADCFRERGDMTQYCSLSTQSVRTEVSKPGNALRYLNLTNDLVNGNTAGAVNDAADIYLASTLAELGSAAEPVGALAGSMAPAAETLEDWNANRNHYQKRSCLRPYLLGYNTKTYPKSAKNFEKPAFRRSETPNGPRKQAFLRKKSSQIRLFMCANSYENTSKLVVDWVLL